MSGVLALSLLFGAAAVVSANVADETDILVIGQRLEGVTVAITGDDRGTFHCGISRSTGVARLDEALCKTATRCVRKGAQTIAAINACVTARKPALLEDVRALLKAPHA